MFCHMCCVRACLYLCVCMWVFQRSESHAWVLTSKRWELTFLPFFIQVILGLGSPAAWHTNDATPPEMPVWSSGDLMKLGKPESRSKRGRGRCKVIRNGRGRGNGGQRGGGGMKVMLVPVTSACKTYLSMGITFSTQKATMRKTHTGIVAVHTCSSVMGETFCLCVPACHCIMLNFSPQLWHTVWKRAKFVARRQWSCSSSYWTWGAALNSMEKKV